MQIPIEQLPIHIIEPDPASFFPGRALTEIIGGTSASNREPFHTLVYSHVNFNEINMEDSSFVSIFTHNEHIDFIIAANNYKKRDKLSTLIDKLIKNELEISKTLEQIQFEDKKYDYFQSNIIFKNFEDS